MKRVMIITLAMIFVLLVATVSLAGPDTSPMGPDPGSLVSGPDSLPSVGLH